VFDIQRLRAVLAVDAVGTLLVGTTITLRPGLLRAAVPDGNPLVSLEDGSARRIGLAVATFGTAKGLLYAGLLVCAARERTD